MVNNHCACPSGSTTSSRRNAPRITHRFPRTRGRVAASGTRKVSSRPSPAGITPQAGEPHLRDPAVEVARDGLVGEPSPEPEPCLEPIVPRAAKPLVVNLREFPQRRGARAPRTVERGWRHRPRPKRVSRQHGDGGPIAGQAAPRVWVSAERDRWCGVKIL